LFCCFVLVESLKLISERFLYIKININIQKKINKNIMINVGLMILSMMVTFFWFIVGVSFYSYLLRDLNGFKLKLKSCIDSLTFMALFIF
jgi:hypothetical protein